MEVGKLLNSKPQPQRKIAGARRQKKKRVTKKTRINVAEHAPKYEFLPESAKASCVLKFGQLLRGDAVEAKREMDKIFSVKSPLKDGVDEKHRDHGRLVIKKIIVKVYGMGARALLNSGVLPNVLSKEFVDCLGIEPDNTNRRITAVMGEKCPVVGMIKDVPIHLDKKVVNPNFLVVQGSPYDVIVGDPTMESMEGVLDLGHRVGSFVVYGDKIEIPREPEYVQEDAGYKVGTDTDDFTSATSAEESEERQGSELEASEEELIPMINDGEIKGAVCDSTDSEPCSGGEKFESVINPGLAHLSKRQAKRITPLLKHGEVVAYSLHDLRQASVNTRHQFELSDDRPLYAKNRRMTTAHQKLVK